MIYKKREILFVILIFILLSISVYAPVEIEKTEGRDITVKCQSSVGDVRSVKARVKLVDSDKWTECEKVSGWLSEALTHKIKYKCSNVPRGEITIECYVDPSISYTRTSPAGTTSCIVGDSCTTQNCPGTFDANCNCVDTPNDCCPCVADCPCTINNCQGKYNSDCSVCIVPDDCLVSCNPGQYYTAGICKQCGGVRFCAEGDIYYCGVSDGVCPATYGANCANDDGCNDDDCTGCTACGNCNNPDCW